MAGSREMGAPQPQPHGRSRHWAGKVAALLRGTDGSAVVETAIALPLLILLLLGIAETGRLVWTNTMLRHATDEAARLALTADDACETSVRARLVAATAGSGAAVTTRMIIGAGGMRFCELRAALPVTLRWAWLERSLTLEARSEIPLADAP